LKYVLTIAGFDPSNGAGLTADIKTFETIGVYGLSVCTAVTVQHESKFNSLDWVKETTVLEQLSILLEKYPITVVKVGLIEHLELLNQVIHRLRKAQPAIQIIWDPILKASAGFQFHNTIDSELFTEVAKKCYLITPNKQESAQLFGALTDTEIVNKYTNLLLKGGHENGDLSTDILFEKEAITKYSNPRLEYSKHGTGCVLSAAIAAYLVQGNSLKIACQKAKEYVTRFIQSTDTLLGKHS